MSDVKPIEFRICWNASSNASFHGQTDWQPWDGDETTTDDIWEALASGGNVSDGLEMALEGSGFEWWVETRGAEPK